MAVMGKSWSDGRSVALHMEGFVFETWVETGYHVSGLRTILLSVPLVIITMWLIFILLPSYSLSINVVEIYRGLVLNCCLLHEGEGTLRRRQWVRTRRCPIHADGRHGGTHRRSLPRDATRVRKPERWEVGRTVCGLTAVTFVVECRPAVLQTCWSVCTFRQTKGNTAVPGESRQSAGKCECECLAATRCAASHFHRLLLLLVVVVVVVAEVVVGAVAV
jgi:hypothetical protein